MLRWGKIYRRKKHPQPSAPNFLYKEALSEPYNSAKSPGKPLATGAFRPVGVKKSLPALYQKLVGMVAPQVRLELTTLRLTAECSAIELLRIIFSIHLFSYVREREKLPFLPLPFGSRQLPTLPSRSQLSTISVWRLNFCVRYGYRWCPPAIVTGNFPSGRSLSLPVRFASLSASASRTLRFSRSLSPHLQNCTGQS